MPSLKKTLVYFLPVQVKKAKDSSEVIYDEKTNFGCLKISENLNHISGYFNATGLQLNNKS